jgi:hypothetical protein
VLAARLVGVLAAAGLLVSAGCASGGSAGGSPTRHVRLTVHLGQAQRPVRVAQGSRISVAFPHNPMGRWTSPTADRPDVVGIATHRTPAGMTVEIRAERVGATTVRVNTIPSGDLRPPGTVPYPHWSLHLTVTS